MQLIRHLRTPALACSLAVLLCELISHPYANIGISDDGPYTLVAKHLATTGHIVYNGWSAAGLVCQLYLGAAFIKLFGFSFTTVRMSTLVVAVLLAFFLQRIMVRAAISERNATIGTLALVLSPLYLMLSVTFMSDIHGLFAIVLCLYGCLRALQSQTNQATISWLCFAVVTNAVGGTSRQIAWLGILVMVPSTLWLLRGHRRVLFAGAAACLAGVLFILGCMVWFKHQPYTTPEHFRINKIPSALAFTPFIPFFLDIPFLLFPLTVAFIPRIRTLRPRVIAILAAAALLYARLALHRDYLPCLEPTMNTGGDWVSIYGLCVGMFNEPIFLARWARILFTVATIGGLLGILSLFLSPRNTPPIPEPRPVLSWKQLGVLLVPFMSAYVLLLLYRAIEIADAGTGILFDRYSLGLLLGTAILLVRLYQDRVSPKMSEAWLIPVGLMAIYGIATTHNNFAVFRARTELASQLNNAGIPSTQVDNGWEYNVLVELQYADYINNPQIESPAHAVVTVPTPPTGVCQALWYDYTPHIHPLYGVSFIPNVCDDLMAVTPEVYNGPVPLPPVHYSRWLSSSPGTLYVVNYQPASKH